MNNDEEQQNESQLKKVEISNGKINFACLKEKCPNSCCGPFGGVQRGIDSIEGRKFSEIVLTPEDSKRLLASGCAHLIELTDKGKYRMKLHEDGTCIAFVNGKCSIHEVKPTVCRAFPFYIDMFAGLCGIIACPGFGSGWTKIEDLSEEVQSAKKMYQHWVDEIEASGKSSDD